MHGLWWKIEHTEIIRMFNFLSKSLRYSKVRLPLLNLNEASPNFANCLKLGQASSHQRPFQNLRCHFMQFAFFRSLGHGWIQHLILSNCILYFMIYGNWKYLLAPNSAKSQRRELDSQPFITNQIQKFECYLWRDEKE